VTEHRLWTAEDVAERLRMRPDFVYALCRRKQIPHVRLGRSVRFRPEAIARWLEEQERGSNGRGLS
jgi:excisionase family DNA binding protein